MAELSPRARRALQLGLRAALVLAVLGGTWLFVRGTDWSRVAAALRAASLPLLLSAALVNLLHLGFRVLRLEVLLAPARRVPVGRLYRYSLALCAGNNLLPARAGEAVRVWLLHSRERIAPGTSVAASVAEKICDLVALLLLAAPLPWLLAPLPPWLARGLVVSTGVAALLVAAVAVFLRLHRDVSRETLLGKLALGAHALSQPRALLLVSLWSVCIWASDAAVLLLSLRAVSVQVPPAGLLLVLLTLNLAIALPSTPAQVGAFELGALVALRLLHVPEAPALAVALLYHFVQVVPVTVLGLPDLLLLTRARAAARAGSSPAAPAAPPRGR